MRNELSQLVRAAMSGNASARAVLDDSREDRGLISIRGRASEASEPIGYGYGYGYGDGSGAGYGSGYGDGYGYGYGDGYGSGFGYGSGYGDGNNTPPKADEAES